MGSWSTRGDFEVSRDSNKQRKPGGGWRSFPGRANPGTVEFTAVYDEVLADRWSFIMRRVGRGTLSGTETMLNADDKPTSRKRSFSGRLLSATLGGTDINTDDPRQATVVCDVETFA
jgi:hypothetical protein